MLSRRSFLTTASAALLLPSPGATSEHFGGSAFGSYWRVTVSDHVSTETRPRMVDVLALIDALFSPYRPDSTLSRVNGRELATSVPPAFAQLSRQALTLASDTGGAFDPTVGPLVARQGFGPIEGTKADWRDIEVSDAEIRKAHPKVTLDLCGVAKGQAVDDLCRLLSEIGVSGALVDVGGETRSFGKAPSGRHWRTAISDPFQPDRARAIVAPRNKAVATSGPLPQGHPGPRAATSHLIDPRTGRPIATELASVTVLSDDAAHADAQATALCVLGPEDGPVYADARGIAAFFIIRDGPHVREISTGAFDEYRIA